MDERPNAEEDLPRVSLSPSCSSETSHPPLQLSSDTEQQSRHASVKDSSTHAGLEVPCLSLSAGVDTAALSEANRAQAEEFIRYALADLDNDFSVLSFSPLPRDMLEQNYGRLLAPAPGQSILDLRAFPSLSKRKVIVGVYTLKDDQDTQAVGPILAQLSGLMCLVIVVALLPVLQDPAHQLSSDEIVNIGQELLAKGAEDTLFDPMTSPGSLQHSVSMLLFTHDRNFKDMQRLLQREAPLWKSLQEVKDLARIEFELLWKEIPRNLMPKLPLADRTIYEADDGVGDYRFESVCRCNHGQVLIARSAHEGLVAVKTIKKIEVHTGDEIEDLYRECRFLREKLQHPHIAKCVDILHTPTRFHMVLEYAGNQSLEQYCHRQQCKRLDEDEAMLCFKQLASALGYIHREEIVHRCVSLHHVVVKLPQQNDDQRLHCTLVDFRSAMLPKQGRLFFHAHGTLPYMAPEMAWEEAYIAQLVDSWSLGIVLLEIAGGLKSVEACANVRFDQQALPQCLRAIQEFFGLADCHEKALAKQNNVQSPQILAHLKALLVLEPTSRMRLPRLAEILEEISEDAN